MAFPVVPVVPYEDPNQTPIPYAYKASPYGSLWWTYTTITDIPKDAVGWLVAQGWIVNSVRYDAAIKPPEPYYTLVKKKIENWSILASLLTEFTNAQNIAGENNTIRYNDVVNDWTQMLVSSQAQFDAQVDEQNTHIALYLVDLVTYMTAVDKLINDNQSDLAADADFATTALTELDTKLADLETNVATSTTTIENLLTDQAGYLSTFLTDFAAKLAELDTNYGAHLTALTAKLAELDTNYAAHLGEVETLLEDADMDLATFASTQSGLIAESAVAYMSHVFELDTLLETAGTYLDTIETDINAVLDDIAADYTDVDTDVNALLTDGNTAMAAHASDYNAVLSLLESDYDNHAPIATNFLIGLGVTETARIKEKFVASLSTELQLLMDRGLYSSAVAADITARNTRDHNEEIVALNDMLNREKFENQHRLYGQQVAMRTGTMAGKDRVHGLQQELFRYQASQITGLHGLQQSMRDRTQAGKQAIYAIKDANNRLNIEVKSRLYAVGQEMRRVLLEEAARLQQLSLTITQWKAGQRDRLYGQEHDIVTQQLAGINQLLEQVQQVVTQRAAGIDRQHTAEQSVSGAAVAERNVLLGQLQEAVKGVLAGKERYAAMTMQNASTLADHRHRMIIERMNTIAFRQNGGQTKHDELMTLMKYQLDERNKLLVGLYGFVERREDIGPKMEHLTQLCTSLGDSGGGWITP